jgi:hypothetical protein
LFGKNIIKQRLYTRASASNTFVNPSKKNKSNKFLIETFYNQYYIEFYDFYGISEDYNVDARTTTAENRVPSLVQLCSFFGFVKETDKYYIFSLPRVAGFIHSDLVIPNTEVLDPDDVYEAVDDISDDLAVKDSDSYSSQADIDESNNRLPSLKEGDKTNHRYSTDPKLGKTAIEKANYVCELSHLVGDNHETFESNSGHLYLEAHHLIPMKAQKDFPSQNLDRLENIVAICPNCHRAIHYGTLDEKIKFLKPLYENRIVLLRNCNHHIDISFSDLIDKYYK